MPTTELTEEDFTEGAIDILTLLAKSGLVPSKSEARRAVPIWNFQTESGDMDS